jgi:hypothetical protein
MRTAARRTASEGSARCRRVACIRGVGPKIATAIVAAIGDGREFENGRHMAAWLGLVPRQHSSGDRRRLMGISKRGDQHLRTLRVHGARAVVRTAANKTDAFSGWVKAVKERRGNANKNARVIWALLRHGTEVRSAASPAGRRCKRQRKWIDRSDPVREEPDFYKGLRDRPLVEARARRITHLGAPAPPATPDRCWHPTWSETSLKQLARGEPSIDVWIAEVNGLLVDLRTMPREVQEVAFARGIIPYIPADGQDRS